jgi:tetratricopeptide (TPR) repeat protein
MGSVYRIQSIELNEIGFWDIYLKLTDEHDKELQKLREHMKGAILVWNPLCSLAKLMVEMGNYDQARKYCLLFLEDDSIRNNFSALSDTYNQLGIIHIEQKQTEKAIEHFEKSLEIASPHAKTTDPSLAPTYGNLGKCYHEQGDHEKALTYFQKALDIELTTSTPKQANIASHYMNIRCYSSSS